MGEGKRGGTDLLRISAHQPAVRFPQLQVEHCTHEYEFTCTLSSSSSSACAADHDKNLQVNNTRLGHSGQTTTGTIRAIRWQTYTACKSSSWVKPKLCAIYRYCWRRRPLVFPSDELPHRRHTHRTSYVPPCSGLTWPCSLGTGLSLTGAA